MIKTLRLLLPVLAICWLAGCSTSTQVSAPATEEHPQSSIPTNTPATKPFNTETLYSLLAAEFAGSRQQYDLALSNYAQQARETQDPQIAERATLMARYLGDTDTALETSRIWLDSAPDNRDALANSALAQLEAGQFAAAFSSSRQLLERGGEPLFPLIAARAATLPQAEHTQLLGSYQALLEEHQQSEQLLVGTGLLLEQEGSFDLAMERARAALKVNPSSTAAAILEASLLHQLKRDDEALAKMRDLLQQHPENNRLRQEYARILSRTNPAEAQRQFAMLARQFPQNGDIWLSLGIVSLQLGDSSSARTAFETLADLDQHQTTAHYYLGHMAEDENRPAEAIVHYLQVDSGKDFLSATLSLLNLFMQQGDYENARQHINRLSLRFPEQADALFLLHAEILRQHEQFQAAEDALNEALANSPDNSHLLFARAMLNTQRQRHAAAEADLRRLLTLDPEQPQALNALGYLLADRGVRLDEARKLLEQALALNPGDPATEDSMGWLEFRSDNLPAARRWLQQAFDASGDSEIGAHLGEVLWISGDQQGARSIWEKALTKARDAGDISPVLRETLQRFQIPLDNPAPNPQPESLTK